MSKDKKYNHVEAFCLMKYQSKDGQITEMLWNSRDGVTPFGIRSKDGTTELFHVEWQRDVCCPDHKPQKGDRIFVDLTPEKARFYAERNVENNWDRPSYPMSEMYETKEEAIEKVSSSYLVQKGSPDVITVGEEVAMDRDQKAYLDYVKQHIEPMTIEQLREVLSFVAEIIEREQVK